MILILRTSKVTECILLDTTDNEATFIFRAGNNVSVTNELFGKAIPEGGATASDAKAHVAYHNGLQAAYNMAFPADFVNCTDTAVHGHYTVGADQRSAFYMAMMQKRATFGLTQAPFKPAGEVMAFAPPS